MKRRAKIDLIFLINNKHDIHIFCEENMSIMNTTVIL